MSRHLPVLGVGPLYVGVCLVLTGVALLLKHIGLLSSDDLPQLGIILIPLGIVLILLAIFLWLGAVVHQKMVQGIKEGRLITTGVYSIVRNPVYSSLLFMFSGILLLQTNIYLLLLPIIFWGFMTVLLKKTEERWLLETFGQEYKR